jgi:hypothetical protein
MLLILGASLAATAKPAATDQPMPRMTAMYEQLCLTAFPDDAAVIALMTARRARELTPAEVKVTMGDDPARGWELDDGSASVWIEFPPFHACSVRWSATAIGDLGAYRAIADDYERKQGGFEPIRPFDMDQGDIHIHAVGEQRVLPDQSTEALFFFEQHITDAKRRAAGETGVSLRFVHQFGAPGSACKK